MTLISLKKNNFHLKMSFFSFHCNKNLIYIAIYWILGIFLRLLIYLKYEFFKIAKNNPAQNEYIYVIYHVISNILGGFLILYIKCSLKRKNEKKNKDKMELIYENPMKKKNKYFYWKLILISSLELLDLSCYFIFFLTIQAKNEDIDFKTGRDIIILLDILFRYILSIFILKLKTYKHRICALLAISISFILLVPIDIINLYNKQEFDTEKSLKFIGILSLRYVLFPLVDTLIKKLYLNYYILPEYLEFYIGIIEIFISIVLTPIFYISKVFDDNLDFDIWNSVMSIFYILVNFVNQYIILKIVYLFSSQSVSILIISTSIAGSIKDIIGFFNTEDKTKITIYNYLEFVFGLIAIFTVVFGTLIHEEIIIINKWGLNLDVKRGIENRSLSDFQETIADLDLESDEKSDNLDISIDNITN